MPTIPNISDAIIAPEKLSDYLLDINHPDGGPKARFFLRFGFSPDRPDILAAALVGHAAGLEATISQRPNALNYVVTGPISTPDGRAPRIRTVWQVRDGESTPRFVTAFPRRRR